jgi:hypothetical protein
MVILYFTVPLHPHIWGSDKDDALKHTSGPTLAHTLLFQAAKNKFFRNNTAQTANPRAKNWWACHPNCIKADYAV